MNATEPRMITLRTGAEVPEPVVKTTLISIVDLNGNDPVALFEAYEVAKDQAHVPFGRTGEVLTGMGLLERDGTMHGATRDVILAAIEGYEDFDVRLVSPFPATEAQS